MKIKISTFLHVAIAAFILSLACVASAATVQNSNDSGTGSFRAALDAAVGSDTINFAPSVTQIDVTTPLSSTKTSLTITGNDAATPFRTSVTGIISGILADPDTISGLPQALDSLQGPTPILNGSNLTVTGPDDRLLTLSAAAGTHNLSQLTFQNGVLKYTSPAIDNLDAAPTNADNSANTSRRLEGGALRIASAANLDATLFLNNGIIAQAGTATAGDATASASAYALALADAHGGGGVFPGSGRDFKFHLPGKLRQCNGR